MSITFEAHGPAVVADVQGRLDSTNAAAVEAELFKRLGSGAFILDFTRLDYISSAGLRVVLVVAKRLKQSGNKFILAGLQPHIKDVFEISGFLGILDVADNRADALARL
ncbi:STAS domain-containing protein [Corticibacterium sp. UT-5YL-CI-8]|nr:STAS domain-containing protein [Tianweitania sp. UT-5YL-CI-8]